MTLEGETAAVLDAVLFSPATETETALGGYTLASAMSFVKLTPSVRTSA